MYKRQVKTGLLPADMIEKLRQSLAESPIKGAVDIQFGGEGEDIAETQNFLGKAFSISLLLMVIVLMIQFNSGWQAIVTMSAIILSTGGVFWGCGLVADPLALSCRGLA